MKEGEGEILTLRSENEEENEAGISPWKVWRSGEGEGEEKTIRRKEKEEEERKKRKEKNDRSFAPPPLVRALEFV